MYIKLLDIIILILPHLCHPKSDIENIPLLLAIHIIGIFTENENREKLAN